MKTKKQLRIELEKAENEIAALKDEIETLEKQRTDLVNKLSDAPSADKATKGVYVALAENISKSLKSKQIINMTDDEVTKISKFFELATKSENSEKPKEIERIFYPANNFIRDNYPCSISSLMNNYGF